MKAFRDLLIICVINSCAKITLACNGYGLKVNSVKNCNNNNVIRIDENFAVSLDKNCNIVPKGCATITKPFKTFDIKYTLNKPPLQPLDGNLNICDLVERKSISVIFSAFALPTKCPVKAEKICMNGNKKFNISKYRMQLGLVAGNTKLKLEGTHDTGKTCILLDISILKQ